MSFMDCMIAMVCVLVMSGRWRASGDPVARGLATGVSVDPLRSPLAGVSTAVIYSLCETILSQMGVDGASWIAFTYLLFIL